MAIAAYHRLPFDKLRASRDSRHVMREIGAQGAGSGRTVFSYPLLLTPESSAATKVRE
jgi:hypothetical protein